MRDKPACIYDFRKLRSLDAFTTRYIWPREQAINGELQFYVDPTARPEHSPFALSSAGLSIVARPTPAALADYAVTDKGRRQPYVSGVLTTRDRGYSQLFGTWIIRARLPSARGAWPGLWLLPTFEQWPSGVDILSEIDIMEAVADVRDGVYHATYHTRESGALKSSGSAIKTDADLTGTFHDYGFTWTPESLIWTFDGREVRRATTPSDMQDEPRHLLMNLAVGGSWGGNPAKGGAVPDPADYPASLDIEWVRIYAHEAEKAPPKPEPPPKTTGQSMNQKERGTHAAIVRYAAWLASDSAKNERIKQGADAEELRKFVREYGAKADAVDSATKDILEPKLTSIAVPKKSRDEGETTRSDWQEWSGLPVLALEGEEYVSITEDGAIRHRMSPQGGQSTRFDLRLDLPDTRTCRLAQTIHFEEKFDFAINGKVGFGLRSDINSSGGTPARDGWSVRVAWGRNPDRSHRLELYIYDATVSKYGRVATLVDKIKSGEDYPVEIELKTNSAAGKADGVLRARVDGNLVVDEPRVHFQSKGVARVQQIRYIGFHGGKGDEFEPSRTGYVCISDVTYSTAGL